MEKLTAFVLSNDGDRAELRLSNGDRVHVNRIDPSTTPEIPDRTKFLEDFPPGLEIADDLTIERAHLN